MATGAHSAFRAMRSRLLLALLTSVLATPVYAQFLGGSASDEENLTAKPLGETPPPDGRTPDRSTKPPQQVDLRAPEQIDFSVKAAAPHTPEDDPRDRAPERRKPGSLDRAVDRLADEAVDSRIGARNTTKNAVDEPSRVELGAAPRGFAGSTGASR